MSIAVMTQVWKRYPNGGGEMLLALALADHSHDDGTHIWPSIKQLAEKTRQSERTVQYQLRSMETAGWLILVNAGNGGRNQHREYRIHPAWVGGAKIAPHEESANGDGKGATDDRKGAIPDTKGCNGLHPHITTNNHQEPPEKHKAPRKRSVNVSSAMSAGDLVAQGLNLEVAEDWMTIRTKKNLPLTRTGWKDVKAEAEKAGMTPGEAVEAAVIAGWAGFKAKWLVDDGGIGKGAGKQKGANQHGDFGNQDYRAGVGADGTF